MQKIATVVCIGFFLYLFGCTIADTFTNIAGTTAMLGDNMQPNIDGQFQGDSILPSINNERIVDNGFVLPFEPNRLMPELTVIFTPIGEPINAEFFLMYVYSCTLKQDSIELQSFEIESTKKLDPSYIRTCSHRRFNKVCKCEI